ncbi:MAG TPA: hypothetical protein VF138_08940 [Caulobacteraceae bacterium]
MAIASGQTAAAAEPGLAPEAAQIREDELLLFAVDLGGLTIADTIAAYGDPDDPLVPFGELSRLLDLDIDVSPGDRRITGHVGEAQRALTVDLDTHLARVGGKAVDLAPGDVAATATDIFIRASAISKLLPITIKSDPEALLLRVTATETLPIQARLERIARLRDLRPDVGGTDKVMVVETPYRLWSMPAFDIALSSEHDTRAESEPRRYDVRIGADLLHMGFQGYFGSDDTGQPSVARFLFERHDVKGGLLGPLDATSVQVGDTFTPTLPIGPRSVGGRGFNFTTAPLEQASVFSRVDLRGELPIGYDVELYVNDVLRSGQRTPVEGRYEFLQVPLSRGLNVIRIVMYGPRGERSEQTRVVNVGGGQLEPGQTTFDFGVVQQDEPLLDLTGQASTASQGRWRVSGNVTRGFTEKLTVTAGAAYYPDDQGTDRGLLAVGARTSVKGFAVQADVASDSTGASGLGVGIAGQIGPLSIIGRHAEYRGGFVDEANPAIQLGRPMQRHSEISVDASVSPGGRSIPLAFRAQREVYDDTSTSLLAAARASSSFGTMLVSGGLDFRRDTDANGTSSDRLTGVLSGSTFAAYRWQLRAALDYTVVPDAKLTALSITADRALSERMALRFGVGHSFADSRTTLQAGANWRLRQGDLALSGDYATDSGDWRLGVQYAMGLVFDPFARRYVATRPGPAAGGNLAFQSFVDANGNGRFDPGEEPVAGLVVNGGERPATTTANGRAFLTGLGSQPTSQVQVGLDGVDDIFLKAPPQSVQFAPRAGGVTRVYYPLTPTAEVLARIVMRQEDGKEVGLSAVHLLLTRNGGEPIEATTEFDGSVAFEGLPAGDYTLTLDPDQAARLHMRLAAPVTFTVRADTGYMPDVRGEVVFEKADRG